MKSASLIDEETRENPEKLIETMKPKKRSKQGEKGLFEQDFEHLLNQRFDLYKLANRLPWERFEEAVDGYYAEVGRAAKAIRQIVGLLLVKQLKNVSDEEVFRLWTENPYVQYPAWAGCGEEFFQWGQPCNPSDLVHFRNRIGEKGVEEIFKASVYLHRERIEEEDELVVDTTVQEENVTNPKDVKLRRKIPARAGWKQGEVVGIKWDHSYKRKVSPAHAPLSTNPLKPAGKGSALGGKEAHKTYSGLLIRVPSEATPACMAGPFERKADRIWVKVYREELDMYKQVLSQKRHDKSKIYSLHDPTVLCTGKGKSHKKWGTEERSDDKPSEARSFVRKTSVAMTRDDGVIVGAVSFEENIWDGETLDMTLIQAKSVSEKDYKSALVDRGYQGRTKVSGMDILAPHKKKKTGTYYRVKKDRIRFARRAAIEPVISLSGVAQRSLRHLKNDFWMARCFLKEALGASQNPEHAGWINESSFWLNFIRLLRTLANVLQTGPDLNHQTKCLSGGFQGTTIW